MNRANRLNTAAERQISLQSLITTAATFMPHPLPIWLRNWLHAWATVNRTDAFRRLAHRHAAVLLLKSARGLMGRPEAQANVDTLSSFDAAAVGPSARPLQPGFTRNGACRHRTERIVARPAGSPGIDLTEVSLRHLGFQTV